MCVVCVWLEYGAGTEQVRVRHAVTSSRYEIGMVYVCINSTNKVCLRYVIY